MRGERARGEEKGGDALFRGPAEREAREVRKLRRADKSLTRTNPSGSERRERLFWGEFKATEAAEKGRKVFFKTARVERRVRKDPPTPGKE